MRKLFTLIVTIVLAAGLSFAQTGGDKDTTGKKTAGKKAETKSKGKKGGKKSKKNSGGTTTPPPK